MRYVPGIVLLVASALWLGWFASGVAERAVQDDVTLSRHFPPDTVMSPYARVSGRPDGDFIRRCQARTTWYQVRWIERQHADEANGGAGSPEGVAVGPRWDRASALFLLLAIPGVLWHWMARRAARGGTSSVAATQWQTPAV